MSRIKVTGYYLNPSTYILVREDGSEYLRIVEGQPFTIDNQYRPWVPVRVARKKGYGTILVCRKFGDHGNVIEEFSLLHNRVGLWATSSGSARKGVFHRYIEPKSELERQLDEMEVSRSIIEHVDTIDLELEVGGMLCSHCVSKWGYGVVTDGEVYQLTEPEFSNEPGAHYGCMESTYKVHVVDATYLIYYSVHTSLNGTHYRLVERVVVTPKHDENVLVDELKKI